MTAQEATTGGLFDHAGPEPAVWTQSCGPVRYVDSRRVPSWAKGGVCWGRRIVNVNSRRRTEPVVVSMCRSLSDQVGRVGQGDPDLVDAAEIVVDM